MRRALLATALIACGDGARHVYPLDGTLRLDQIQAKGTHNSYHVITPTAPPHLQYGQASLTEQLEHQGVRHFELDLYFFDAGPDAPHNQVHHLPYDWATTCERLSGCLDEAARWSRAHPDHAPLLFLLEPKDELQAARVTPFFDTLEAEVVTAFGRDAILTPARVQGADATLRAAVVGRGWPTLGELRGQVLFVLLNGDAFRTAYRARANPLFFVLADPGDPDEAIRSYDDPVAQGAEIRAAVADHLLVRTRADADTIEAKAGDRGRAEAALASGAQLISTDYPVPYAPTGYVFDIPQGTPSRCNPVSAPPACTSADVEARDD